MQDAQFFKAYQRERGVIAVQFKQEAEGDALFTIYTMTGGIVFRHQIEGLKSGIHETVVPSALSPAIYLLRMNNGSAHYSKKIVIE